MRLQPSVLTIRLSHRCRLSRCVLCLRELDMLIRIFHDLQYPAANQIQPVNEYPNLFSLYESLSYCFSA